MPIPTYSIMVLLTTILAISNCGDKKDKSTGNNSTSSDAPTEKSDGDGQSQPGSINLAGTLALSTSLRLTADTGELKILAISSAGDQVEGTVSSDGKFTLPLAKDSDQNSVIAIVDQAKSGQDMIVARLKLGDLNSLSPTESSADDLDLGSLEITTAAAVDALATMNTSDEVSGKVLEATNISADDAATYGQFDKAALKVANIDVDGDGKIDAKGDYSLKFSFGFSSAADPKNAISTLSNYKNNFLADNFEFTKGRYAITVTAKKSLFSSVPTNATWSFSKPLDLDDSGTDITINSVKSTTWNETVTANTTITKAFQINTDPDNQSDSYEFGLTVKNVPEGSYKLVIAGKTLNFVNVVPGNYNDVPPIVPFVKINVDSTEHVTGIDYKWMARKTDASGWAVATPALVRMFVEKNGAHFSYYAVVNGQRQQKRFEWLIAPDAMTGTIQLTADTTCLASLDASEPMGCSPETNKKVRASGFKTFEEAKSELFSVWGWNNFTFVDKLGAMVSAN